MDDLTDEQIEAYLKQRKAKVKKPPIKIDEEIVLDDLVDEIITTYTEAQKRTL